MIIGTLSLELYLPENSSLKEKRMILRSVKDRLRRRFNIAVAEIGEGNKWQRAQLGVATAGTDKQAVNRTLSLVIKYLEEERRGEILDYQMEIF